MRIVVIGGSGFIGCNIVKYFSKKNNVVISCDSRKPQAVYDGVTYIQIKEDELDKYNDVLREGDVVVLLRWCGVSTASLEKPIESTEINLVGTMKIMSICAEKKVERILFSSSGGTVYGVPEYVPIKENHPTRPLSLYGNQKLMIENYMVMFKDHYKIPTFVLRISNPYGPGQPAFMGQGVIATFLASALLGKGVDVWGTGDEERDYLYIDDLSECIEKVIEYKGDHCIFNIGSGVGTSLKNIVSNVSKVCQRPINVNHMSAKEGQVKSNVLDCTRAKNELGWSAHTSLYDGMVKMRDCFDKEQKKFIL